MCQLVLNLRHCPSAPEIFHKLYDQFRQHTAGPVLLDAGEKVDEVGGHAGYLHLDREGLLGEG